MIFSRRAAGRRRRRRPARTSREPRRVSPRVRRDASPPRRPARHGAHPTRHRPFSEPSSSGGGPRPASSRRVPATRYDDARRHVRRHRGCVYQTRHRSDTSKRLWLNLAESARVPSGVRQRSGDDPRDALRDDDPEDDDAAAEIWLADPWSVGYANDLTRTAERFVRRNERATACGTERWFRTGDVARRARGRRVDALGVVGAERAGENQRPTRRARRDRGGARGGRAETVARVAVATTARSAKSGSNSGPRLVAWCVAPRPAVENAGRAKTGRTPRIVPSAATCDALRWLASCAFRSTCSPRDSDFSRRSRRRPRESARGALVCRTPTGPRRFDDDRIGDEPNDDEWIGDGRERASREESRLAAVSAAWTDALGLTHLRAIHARVSVEHGERSSPRCGRRFSAELGVEDEGGAFGESLGAPVPAALLAARTLGAHARAVRDAAAAGRSAMPQLPSPKGHH